MYQNKSKTTIIVLFFFVVIILLVVMIVLINSANKPPAPPENNTTVEQMSEEDKRISFDYKIIRGANNNYNGNYLVSPLTLAYGLKVLESGADSETKGQITTLIKNYNIGRITNISNKISIANALFINTAYKNNITSEFSNNVTNNLRANIMFDDFSSTNSINTWIAGKTFNLVPKGIGRVDNRSDMNLINTMALKIDWRNKMSNQSVHSAPFVKIDGTTINAAFMNDKNTFGYIENEYARGIIKHYASYDLDSGNVASAESINKLDLEYIAIIPKGNINDYIKQLDQYELSKLLSNVKSPSTATDITMTIPKYSYDFTFDKIKLILYEKGITKAFEEGANFKLISKDAKLILSDIIQKTYIDFGEEGTYSAPVYFEKTTAKKKTNTKKTTDTKAAAQPTNETVTPKEQVNIDFNQPFIYIVKERNGTNIWLFGVVYEPTLWEDYAKLVENAKKEYERSLRGY